MYFSLNHSTSWNSRFVAQKLPHMKGMFSNSSLLIYIALKIHTQTVAAVVSVFEALLAKIRFQRPLDADNNEVPKGIVSFNSSS